MKSNEKKMISILLIILVIVVIIFAVTKNKKSEKVENTAIENSSVESVVQVQEDGTKLNTSTKLNEPKEVGGLRFDNIQFTEKNGQTVLLANVTNNSGKATEMTLVEVTLIDKEEKEIEKLNGLISPLQAGASTQLNISTSLDYSDAYDIKIVIK